LFFFLFFFMRDLDRHQREKINRSK
jgi:hypothetical protein